MVIPMAHAPVGDFGPLLNHSLNRIGCFITEQGLSPEDCEAIFEAGMAARFRLVAPFKVLAGPVTAGVDVQRDGVGVLVAGLIG
ncbi:MAG: hypothetical protein NTZ11_18315 [Gammaproteobacteria bacterium]|nr:hypothetical protein [Gammaproteobacteria bacterium]